jgi:hypothetical protein
MTLNDLAWIGVAYAEAPPAQFKESYHWIYVSAVIVNHGATTTVLMPLWYPVVVTLQPKDRASEAVRSS